MPCYGPVMAQPVTGLLGVFSMDFVAPLPRSYNGGPRYLLVCIEHLTVVRAMTDTTARKVIGFTKGDIIDSFGPPRTIVSITLVDSRQ